MKRGFFAEWEAIIKGRPLPPGDPAVKKTKKKAPAKKRGPLPRGRIGDTLEQTLRESGDYEAAAQRLGLTQHAQFAARLAPSPRPFVLVRSVDETGVSGVGVVAEGVEFTDGSVAMRWRAPGRPTSTVLWNSLADAVKIHGHDGLTRVVWTDPLSPRT